MFKLKLGDPLGISFLFYTFKIVVNNFYYESGEIKYRSGS